MALRIAYLAGGKIHLRNGDQPKVTFSSKFGEQIRERAVQVNARHEWKRSGRGAGFAGAMLAGAADRDPAEMRIAITHIARGRKPGELLYALETDDIGGVFALELESGEETRLLHTSDHRVRSLTVGPEAIACALRGKAGTCNVGAMHLDGGDPQLITEGDSIDLAPEWDPKRERELLFQSAGTARDASGFALGLGPSSIQRLHVETAKLEPVLEASDRDYLAPRLGTDGTLHVVRRPYRSGPKRAPWWRFPLDVILVPFRLLRAIFGWLDFFSARYSGKTLMSGGPERRGPDMRQLMLMGNVVDASEEARRERERLGEDGLVPSDWELVRVDTDKTQRVLAKGVAAYDLAPDGGVVYTNGSAVYRVGANGKKQRLFEDEMIEQLVVVPG